MPIDDAQIAALRTVAKAEAALAHAIRRIRGGKRAGVQLWDAKAHLDAAIALDKLETD